MKQKNDKYYRVYQKLYLKKYVDKTKVIFYSPTSTKI